jgi:hypothetical protein
MLAILVYDAVSMLLIADRNPRDFERIAKMETTIDGTFFQEEDHVRVKSTGETGRVNAIAGGVVYVLMDTTNESRLFAAYIDEDAAIELVKAEKLDQ